MPDTPHATPPPPTTDRGGTSVTVPYGAWHGDGVRELRFPAGWDVRVLAPLDAPALDDEAIGAAFDTPVGAPRLRELAEGAGSACIAVDDITRPTPAHRLMPRLLDELLEGGIAADRIRVVLGVAAHRPMDEAEMRQKLGDVVVERFPPVNHDFLGPDVRPLGWVGGGPVHLNRHFADAEVRVVVGGTFPHAEAGFGGGAKMVVPGVAGRASIAFLHGALPARGAGVTPEGMPRDRRGWPEAVAREVGVQFAVCAVTGSRRQLTGLACGDVVEAHRAASAQAGTLGRTPVPADLAGGVDVAIASCYPLDTDPIQMGKALGIGRKLHPKLLVAVNAASDGVHYHGMGMGTGVDMKRLLGNVPAWLFCGRRLGQWLAGLWAAAPSPMLMARATYFSLNHRTYDEFQVRDAGRDPDEPQDWIDEDQADLLLYSKAFPTWSFRAKYPKGRLYRDWDALVAAIGRRFQNPTVAVLPCAPLQLLETGGQEASA